jgi:hypothetical protein
MSLAHDTRYSDEQLARYFLQLLPEDDVERIDELSIADDEMAWRLRVVEDDLVDAYVSGSLIGEKLKQFESVYLASERRRRKVQFARNFLRKVDREAGASSASNMVRPVRWNPPRSMTVSAVAAAAALLLVCGALILRDVQLRNGLSQAQGQSAALERRARELEQQLNDQRSATTEAVSELARVRAAMAELQAESTSPPSGPGGASQTLAAVAILLLPQTRAVGQIPTLDVPQGTAEVTFRLQLESNRFSRYQAAVKDPASNAIVWRAGRLAVTSTGDRPAVSVAVPAGVLKAQHYAIDLMGDSTEVVGTYAVRIALR